VSRTTRLLTLLERLRAKRVPVTASELALDLAVSERTLYRDIATLIEQGAPIHGEAGIGYVLRPGLFLPPLMLSEDEIDAVVLGLRYVDQRGDDVLRKAAAHALAKIDAVLNASGKDAMRAPTVHSGPPVPDFPVNAVPLTSLRAAIRGQCKLRIGYLDVQGEPSNRIVWPVVLGFLDNVRILGAWCEKRQDFRSFRTDRITSADETGERYPGARTVLLSRYRTHLAKSTPW
jgi:predicted DNA-binding transcriptional regulator YafY